MDLHLVSIALCLFGLSLCNLIKASWNQAHADGLYEQATTMLENASRKEDIVRNGLRKMERSLDREEIQGWLSELDQITEKQVQS